ncbi:MAG: HIT domain-containing protein [Legionellaceae bacterium]|nr:HIT domain-containing protein [Legionellaceae bacterium]
MSFCVDERIRNSSFYLCRWPLSDVFLKNDAHYPWLILIPRVANAEEIYALSPHEQALLMQEITKLAQLCQDFFKADKINIGSLGNIVSQLHVHIIARYRTDPLWPQGIWQSACHSQPYAADTARELCHRLQTILSEAG